MYFWNGHMNSYLFNGLKFMIDAGTLMFKLFQIWPGVAYSSQPWCPCNMLSSSFCTPSYFLASKIPQGLLHLFCLSLESDISLRAPSSSSWGVVLETKI